MKKLFILLGFLLLISCSKENQDAEVVVSPKTNKTQIIPIKSEKGRFGTPMKFTSFDLNGNAVTEKIFEKSEVTLVNIWATWCGPCRHELPDLGSISKKYSELGYQVIGFVHDVTKNSENKNVAFEILKDSGCDYLNILNDPSMDLIFSSLTAFPTTLFIDKNGNLIGREYIGAMSESTLDERFESAIKAVSSQ